jgi:hypothetical protein
MTLRTLRVLRSLNSAPRRFQIRFVPCHSSGDALMKSHCIKRRGGASEIAAGELFRFSAVFQVRNGSANLCNYFVFKKRGD